MQHLLPFILLIIFTLNVLPQEYLEDKPKAGDGIDSFLRRYDLIVDTKNKSTFYDINPDKFTKSGGLILGQFYKLPIQVFTFDDVTIRSSIGNQNYQYALSIQHYNERMFKKRVKAKDFRDDKRIWVPVHEFINQKVEEEVFILRKRNIPLLGEKYENVQELDHKLKGMTFYLVAGHGGPDPGAIGNKNGHPLHEDEYAYDVILRLGRKLVEHGADIHFIVQDKDDGIRDKQYLPIGSDEVYIGGEPIPADQVDRLHKRSEILNKLHSENKEANRKHHVIVIHIDSRRTGKKQIDIFFYHAPGSFTGQRIANTLKETIEQKYRAAQPGRGYNGSVSSRNLWMLRKTNPPATFIELGNIKNKRDQLRILLPENRQAIANWLCDGLLKEFSEE